MGTVASRRNYHLAQGLKADNQALVITAKYRYQLNDEIHPGDGFFIYEIPNWDYRRWQSRRKTGGARPTGSQLRSWKRKLLDSVPTSLLFGEGGIVYIQKGYRRARALIEKYDIRYIYSSYRPMSDHVIAWRLKKTFPDLVWIADFADLPIDPVFDHVYLPGLQEAFLRKILSRADMVTAVSQGQSKVMDKYTDRVTVVPNGVEPSTSTPRPEPFEKFTLSYTGSLYGKRDPGLLFQCLRKLLDEKKIDPTTFRILYAGDHGPVWDRAVIKYGLENISVNRGRVTHDQALEIQQRSHINILLSWASPEVQGWLTYKLYEYIVSGNPILAIVNGSMDYELRNLIKKYNSGMVIANRSDSILRVTDFLMELYQLWIKGNYCLKLESGDDHEFTFRWSSICRNFRKYIS